MPHEGIQDAGLAELVGRAEQAAQAYIRGDMDAYLRLIRHAPGYTLMNPFGGTPVSYQARGDGVREHARLFEGGEASIELYQAVVSGDLAVLAMIERQHGRAFGLPDQDWSLRVTLVFRREGDDWLLVHRHADPLAHAIGLDQVSALARGDVGP